MEMTYDPTPVDQPEFTPDEVDSLQVGEQLAEAQERMLAGKYENAEQLEKAYLELQSKLGDREVSDLPEEEQWTGDDPEEENTEEEEPEQTEEARMILDASDEWYRTGTISQETFDQLSEMDSQDLIDTYLELQRNQPEAEPTARDLSDAEVMQIKNFAGGDAEYDNLVGWAGENLAPAYVDAFDQLVETGDPATIQLAVAGLMATYQEANGYEGRMYSGNAPSNDNAPVFRSQAEVVQAMSDPRYDSDPAYRQDVFDALERSDIQF